MQVGEGAAVASNGSSSSKANGAGNSASQRTAIAGATNGAHKDGLATNGSANGEKQSSRQALSNSTYHGHNREEVTRILIQALADMGYQGAAESVSQDSGFNLESPTVAAFRSAVLDGSWVEAEQLLQGAEASEVGGNGNGLVLASGSDPMAMRLWLRQQKFLELLEERKTSRALAILRAEITPICTDQAKISFLSGLVMCSSASDVMTKANWDGAAGNSRHVLLSELSKCISPSVMLPENRLATLLQQVKQSQIDTCMYHTAPLSPSLYADHLCDRRNFPTEVALELPDLGGEVWQLQFSHDGKKLAACGSPDQVIIWSTDTFTVVQTLDGHDGGVGNLAWSPDDTMLVTCAQDKYARLWNANAGTLLKKVKRFEEPVSGCVWANDSRSLVIGTLDRTLSLCTFNMDDDEIQDWGKKHRVQDLCGSRDGRYLVAVDDQHNIHVYNGLTRELEYDIDLKARPTSVSISQDSRHLLVNKRDGEAQLIDLTTRETVKKFLGHTGGDYVIRSAFGGANESFVISGSEDGNILIWHKNIGAPVERLTGHIPRTNAVAWNPTDACMLASCGDDEHVKIWTNKARARDIRARRPRSFNNSWRMPDESAT